MNTEIKPTIDRQILDQINACIDTIRGPITRLSALLQTVGAAKDGVMEVLESKLGPAEERYQKALNRAEKAEARAEHAEAVQRLITSSLFHRDQLQPILSVLEDFPAGIGRAGEDGAWVPNWDEYAERVEQAREYTKKIGLII